MREYLVVLPLRPMPEGATYALPESLPLHCTVMPWFHAPLTHGAILDLLRTATQGRAAPLLTSWRSESFGAHLDIPVHLVLPTIELNGLHTVLLLKLARRGAIPRTYEWVGAGYRAHVTDREQLTFHPGETYQTAEAVLVERTATRKIVRGSARFSE